VTSLRAGFPVRLQFSALTGVFTGYVEVFNVKSRSYEYIHWQSIEAMIARQLVQLDGNAIETSREVILDTLENFRSPTVRDD